MQRDWPRTAAAPVELGIEEVPLVGAVAVGAADSVAITGHPTQATTQDLEMRHSSSSPGAFMVDVVDFLRRPVTVGYGLPADEQLAVANAPEAVLVESWLPSSEMVHVTDPPSDPTVPLRENAVMSPETTMVFVHGSGTLVT